LSCGNTGCTNWRSCLSSHSRSFAAEQAARADRIIQITFTFKAHDWDRAFRTTLLNHEVAPSGYRKNFIECDWFEWSNDPVLDQNTVKLLMEAPQTLLRESVFKFLEKPMP
jgi:hypothetical protein